MRKLFRDSIKSVSSSFLKKYNIDYYHAQCESILKSWDGSLIEIFDHIESHKTVRIAIQKETF